MRLTILASLLLTNLAFAGHETGNGTELKDFLADNAWFVENRPVQYCIVRDEKFIAPMNQVKTTVELSLKKWIAEYNLFPMEDIHKLQTSFIFNEICNDQIDLTFYFGGMPEKIKTILERNPRQVGMAYPISSNQKNSWTKGFIYIKDSTDIDDEESVVEEDIPADPNAMIHYVEVADWRKDNNLDAILLHEIGHVFGATHIPGTIMRESLANEMLIDDPLISITKKYKSQINNEYSIVPNDITTELIWNDQAGQKTLSFKGNKYTYTVNDDNYIFYGNDSINSTNYADLVFGTHDHIFRSCILVTPDNIFVEPGGYIEHFVRNGTVGFNGKFFPAIYTKNMGEYTHQIKIFQNGKWESLVQFRN